MSQDERERWRHEARLKFQRDQHMYLKDTRDEGREEGRGEGEIVGVIHTFQRLLKLPMTPREELLALPLEELKATAESLESQLGLAKE